MAPFGKTFNENICCYFNSWNIFQCNLLSQNLIFGKMVLSVDMLIARMNMQ